MGVGSSFPWGGGSPCDGCPQLLVAPTPPPLQCSHARSHLTLLRVAQMSIKCAQNLVTHPPKNPPKMRQNCGKSSKFTLFGGGGEGTVWLPTPPPPKSPPRMRENCGKGGGGGNNFVTHPPEKPTQNEGKLWKGGGGNSSLCTNDFVDIRAFLICGPQDCKHKA